VQTDIINIILSYKHTPYIEVAYTNYFINNLNIFADKTSVPNSSALFIYLSIYK